MAWQSDILVSQLTTDYSLLNLTMSERRKNAEGEDWIHH